MFEQNLIMPFPLKWRLEVAFHNRDKEEIKRLHNIMETEGFSLWLSKENL